MTNERIQISVVVPLYNEDESLPELAAWIHRVMKANGFTYEIIMVDDGSKDQSWEVIERISKENNSVKGIKFKRNYGKSAALHEGFCASTGDVVITMDADLQDSPDEIPELYKMIKEKGYDLVSGWKKKRYDPLSKTIPTKLFNAAARAMSGIRLHDFNCGLKAYKGKVVHSIEVYGEMHRYIPVIAKGAGFGKIGEKVVQHRERKYGVTKFGLDRFINGFLDLLTIFFVGRFGKKPMHFFGTLGIIAFFIGFIILIELSIEKIFFKVGGIADRPLFFLGMLATIIGSQLFLTGFLAELITRNSPSRNNYLIEEKNPSLNYSRDISKILSEHENVVKSVINDSTLLAAIEEFTRLVVQCYTHGGKILLCGNGGSASDAQHIAAEWQGRYLLERKPLHAEALHANTSYLTAVANDYGFDKVFSRAVEAQGKGGDILVGLTTSGNSPNIVNALKTGKSLGMTCIGMTGNKTDPAIEPYCDLMIKVPSDVTARIQEIHILIGHIVCELSEKSLFKS